jgi:NosR/NirI family nitrous oxide reductase transcriptional regulator
MTSQIPFNRRSAFAGKLLTLACLLAGVLLASFAQAQEHYLPRFLAEIPASDLVDGATAYGAQLPDVAAAPILKNGETVGYAFITSDFVATTGYSGKPIHVMAAIGPEARILGAKLVEHSEPIVLVGIPNSKMVALTESYVGLDVVAEAETSGEAHDLEIISGATVTVMIIDDSIVRASIKVARALGLGGLAPEQEIGGPRFLLDESAEAAQDWQTLVGDGTVRRLSLDVGQINDAFTETGDIRAIQRREKGAADERFIDLYTSLLSIPSIAENLLGSNEQANQSDFLQEGDHSILVMARGRYSFKGSGYVRGGIFDRIQLVQGDVSIRFRDKDHRRLGHVAASGAPDFTEIDVFRIPAKSGFDPAQPWDLKLLVQRAVGAVEKTFITFDLGYRLPEKYLKPLAKPAQPAAQEDEATARSHLWKRVWESKKLEIAILLSLLAVLSGTFFFQFQVTRNERVFFWFRMGFLTVTLIFLGWMESAQLSVVNLMALASSLKSGFSWDTFLMDPLVFILWFSVAAALLFWGRGAFCGWLCPFGALQELTNKIARGLGVPQWTLPWGLHERLWPVKYILFLVLVGLALASIPLAETYAEVEPFKTAIVLKFMRAWPFVLFAVLLLVAGLFVERFYCRYLCPLGAALAIPARLRMFNWLKRYHECGAPCQICAIECPVQAIHPTGEINPNECVNCLHCQILYQSKTKCPVVVKKEKRRARFSAETASYKGKQEQSLEGPNGKKEIPNVTE